MLIGHEQLVQDFKLLAARSELSHGYIFSGPARVGKKLFALCFANFLETGEFREPEMSRDAFLLEPNEERIIGIDEIRRIRNFLWQRPIASKKRTVIINDVETMTGEAQNALLKIAEEPPESSLLLLVARDSEKLLPTLRSRLQKVYFSPVPSALIENWLMVRLPSTLLGTSRSPQEEKFDGDRQLVRSIVRLSSGQPGLAWRMLFDERFRALQKSGERLLKSGFWARREMIKILLEKDDFDINEFLEVLLMILSFDRLPFEGLSRAPQGQSNGRMVSGLSRAKSREVEPSGERTPEKINPVRSSHRALNPVFAVEKLPFIPVAEPAGYFASNGINRKLWHKILDLRRNADYLNLNPRLQLENLMNEVRAIS